MGLQDRIRHHYGYDELRIIRAVLIHMVILDLVMTITKVQRLENSEKLKLKYPEQITVTLN